MYKFRLNFGQHTGFDPSGEKDENGRRVDRVYTAPCVVKSETDLVKKHGADKFSYIGEKPRKELPKPVTKIDDDDEIIDETDAGITTADLKTMSKDELIAYAKERDIDLGSANTKAAIIVKMTEALGLE